VVILYNHTVDFFPGTAFIATAAIPAAILLAGAFVDGFCRRDRRRRRRPKKAKKSTKKTLSRERGYRSEGEEGEGYGGYGYERIDEGLPAPRDATQRPDFTQSLTNIPSATLSGYGVFWTSTEW
jgi:hypothetical protein